MSSLVLCPECNSKLKVPETMAGKSFRCPACKTVIPPLSKPHSSASNPDSDEADSPSRSHAARTASSPRPAAVRPRSRPVQEEVLEEVIETEEEEPIREKRPRKRKPSRKKSSNGLIIALGAAGLGLLLLVLGVGGGLYWYFHRNKAIAEAEWQTFTPPGGDCTILMPGTPVPRTWDILGIHSTQYQLEHNQGKEAFIVAFYDVPAKALRPSLLQELANGWRTNVLNITGGGTVTSETPITLGNITGHEYQIKPTANQGILIGRIYLAKVGTVHRAYVVAIGGDYIKPNTGDAARYLDSFKITAAATAPDLSGAAAASGMQPPGFNPPQGNPQPNVPRPNPGFRPPRLPRRQP